MKGYCHYGNMKIIDARKYGVVIEYPDGEHIRCECGKVLKKSTAGFGSGFSIPRHKKGNRND